MHRTRLQFVARTLRIGQEKCSPILMSHPAFGGKTAVGGVSRETSFFSEQFEMHAWGLAIGIVYHMNL